MTPFAQKRSQAEQRIQREVPPLAWIGVALAAFGLLGFLVAAYRRWLFARKAGPNPQPRRPQPQTVLELQGLTEEEAAARQLEGQDNSIRFKPPYSTRQIWQANIVTVFNLSMVGLAVVQVLLGKPFDAFLTSLVLLLGVGLNVGQQLWARGRLKTLEQATRVQATLVREGVVRSVDSGEVVRGDILVVGPGDQVLVDGQVVGKGQIVVDESMLTGDPRQHSRQAGDPVYAGSFCLAGHGAYEAEKVGDERLIVGLTGKFQAVPDELTPLERTMDRLLRVLLVVVAVLSILLLADYFDLLLPDMHMDAFTSAASVIFGIAPSSLFLMILVNYAMGTADLARIGALVHRTRSVESLAQATVLCFAQEGILTGVGVEIEPMEAQSGSGHEPAPQLAESRIRQILGDYARSTTLRSPSIDALRVAFPGEQRAIRDEAPFLSLFGWSAIAFDDEGLRGVYVVGEPEILEAHLVQGESIPEVSPPGSLPATLRSRIQGLRQTLRRGRETSEAHLETRLTEPAAVSPASELGAIGTGGSVTTRTKEQDGGLLQGLFAPVNQLLQPQAEEPDESPQDSQSVEKVVLMVAYFPDLLPLHDSDGRPTLPENLLPLCRLHYAEQVRPEAIEAVKTFARSEVGIKVFASDTPERTAASLVQAGLGHQQVTPWGMTTGPELAELPDEAAARAAADNIIFGQMTPEQEGQVVSALREQGEAVAVIGDAVSDLPAMRQAHLAITRQSSSTAVLSMADIVLLEKSPQALLRVLKQGQRIANGLLDILKLYLNQITYLGLLILVIWGLGLGFPYQSKQGSFVTIVSVILPSLALTLWAPAGVLPHRHLGRMLAQFVAPAAVAISAAGLTVYLFFLDRSGSGSYAQLTLTYMLTISGLVLVVLLRPPWRSKVGSNERSGDWRPAAFVGVLLVLIFVVAAIPLADSVFGLKPLQRPMDYLVIGLAVLAWACVASFLWRIKLFERIWRQVGKEQAR